VGHSRCGHRYRSIKATALIGAGGKQRPKTTNDKRHALLSADFCNKIGTTRHCASPHDFGRKRREADIEWQAVMTASVENDPQRTSANISWCNSEASPYQSTRLSRYDTVT